MLKIAFREQAISSPGQSALLVLHPEMKKVLRLMCYAAWANFGMGAWCIFLYYSFHDTSLLTTGILTILMFWMVQLKAHHARKSRNWIELSMIMICGLYFPFAMMMIAGANVVDILVHHIH